MPTVTPESVARLRARTGVSILACKQALDEAGGDEERAIEILRKRGIAQAVKKAARAQMEGAFFIASGSGKAAVVQLRCETDFVARSDAFLELGQSIADAALTGGQTDAEKLSEQKIPEAVQKLGENITLGEVSVVSAPVLGSYVHSNRKIAVVIGLEGNGADLVKAKDVAMHAAALNPPYVHPEDVPTDVIEKEREIWAEQMKSEKKPPEILQKIIQGKERKFREENALTKQPFVKDSSMTVEKYLSGATVVSYLRLSL